MCSLPIMMVEACTAFFRLRSSWLKTDVFNPRSPPLFGDLMSFLHDYFQDAKLAFVFSGQTFYMVSAFSQTKPLPASQLQTGRPPQTTYLCV